MDRTRSFLPLCSPQDLKCHTKQKYSFEQSGGSCELNLSKMQAVTSVQSCIKPVAAAVHGGKTKEERMLKWVS